MGQNGNTPKGPRCIALVGPFQSGKTTLLDAILARTGAIARQGSVDAGSSVGDASKEARAHKMSVEATFASTTFMGDSYTFVDCPGSVEFIHDMRALLPAVDAAVVVCDRARHSRKKRDFGYRGRIGRASRRRGHANPARRSRLYLSAGPYGRRRSLRLTSRISSALRA